MIGLELILTVLKKPGPIFLQRKEFIEIVKTSLCDGLLKYCVTGEKSIFAIVVSIFWNLFLHFRTHLKQIIFVVLDTFFLKILSSGNSSFHHKQLILSVFDQISKDTRFLLQLFCNYDCEIDQKDICAPLIDSLSRIATGKFTKSEHQSMISSADEYSLRTYATEILVQMLRSFN